MSNRHEAEHLWDFSLRIYSDSAVAEACLELQNRFALDVNVLLFCLWHGRYFGEIPAVVMNTAIDISSTWSSQVVTPLRQARTWMKGRQDCYNYIGAPEAEFTSLRSAIKKLELSAERMQQNKLASLAGSCRAIPDLIQEEQVMQKNLLTYVEGNKSISYAVIRKTIDLLVSAVRLDAERSR